MQEDKARTLARARKKGRRGTKRNLRIARTFEMREQVRQSVPRVRRRMNKRVREKGGGTIRRAERGHIRASERKRCDMHSNAGARPVQIKLNIFA